MTAPSIIILCINLERSTDRRQSILAQAAQHGLEIRIIPAVDGNQLTPQELAYYDAARRARVHNTELLPTELGCTLSHHRALSHFLQSACDYAVVLEDDAALQPNFVAGLRELTEKLRGWDIAKLYIPSDVRTTLLPAGDAGAAVRPIYARKLGGISVGFLYTRRAAELIRQEMEGFYLQADSQIYQSVLNNGLRIIGVQPSMVKPGGFGSTIRFDEPTIKRRTGLRYLRHRLLLHTNMLRKMWIYLKLLISLRREHPAKH